MGSLNQFCDQVVHRSSINFSFFLLFLKVFVILISLFFSWCASLYHSFFPSFHNKHLFYCIFEIEERRRVVKIHQTIGNRLKLKNFHQQHAYRNESIKQISHGLLPSLHFSVRSSSNNHCTDYEASSNVNSSYVYTRPFL